MGKRINNWQIPYQNEIEKPRKFERGKTDCGMFVLECVSKYTNSNLHDKFKNKYSSLSQCIKLFKENNIKGNNLNEYIINFFDKEFERIHINLAQRGDIVGFNSDEISMVNKMINSGFTVGIMCEGFGRFVMSEGYEDIPRENLQMAWRV
tara:strand:- start:654 stop:1103 length:450 start_codon:yes stop_codon:yes gene_type:complete